MPKHYQQGCWYCGDTSHRRFECPKLTAELEKQRADKGAGSGGGGMHEVGTASADEPGPTQTLAMETAWWLGQLAGADEAAESKGLAELRARNRYAALTPDEDPAEEHGVPAPPAGPRQEGQATACGSPAGESCGCCPGLAGGVCAPPLGPEAREPAAEEGRSEAGYPVQG